jgi:segregation and condensation protein A
MAFPRGNVEVELQSLAEEALADAELESLTLYRLLQAFKRVMERFEYAKHHPVHTIIKYNYSVLEEQGSIMDKLAKKPRLDFGDVFAEAENRIHAIITFLALLEMINNQVVRILSGEGINNFWIENHPVQDTHGEEE